VWRARGDDQRRDFNVAMEGANRDRKCAMHEAAAVVTQPVGGEGLSLLQQLVPARMRTESVNRWGVQGTNSDGERTTFDDKL
jgi:hypothetical protein